MKTPATKLAVEVNGKRFSEATVSLEDASPECDTRVPRIRNVKLFLE